MLEVHSRHRLRQARWLFGIVGVLRAVGAGALSTIPAPPVTKYQAGDGSAVRGDEYLEKRSRRDIRWNAEAMVMRANQASDGIGGHLSTYASSATLYEVGFNHFFRGSADGTPGDHVYFQGHATPGVYARAFLEGRLDEHMLDRFRREIVEPGLSSYPHPRLLPDFW